MITLARLLRALADRLDPPKSKPKPKPWFREGAHTDHHHVATYTGGVVSTDVHWTYSEGNR